MIVLNNLTAAGNQTTVVTLTDGSTVRLTFIYRAAVQRWTVDVVRQQFIARGIGLSTFPNLLRSWRYIIPFGLQVTTDDGTDPFLANDLDNSSGTPRVKVAVLDQSAGLTEVTDAEAASIG